MTASCPMKLQYFPMDDQICELEMSSYGFNDNDIDFEWQDYNELGMSSKIHLPKFKLLGARKSKNVTTMSTGELIKIILNWNSLD